MFMLMAQADACAREEELMAQADACARKLKKKPCC